MIESGIDLIILFEKKYIIIYLPIILLENAPILNLF